MMTKGKKPKALDLEAPSTAAGEVDEDLPSSSEEENEIELELADVPLGELLKARADGFHALRTKPDPKEETKHRRTNKNRPMEMSSKMPVGRFRRVIEAPKKVFRDPRFESLSGDLDTEGFRKRYNFLFEVELPSEKEKLQKLLKKEKDPNAAQKMRDHIAWINKQLQSGQHKKARSQILAEHIKKEKEAAKQGKQPYYLKKSEIRERELINKYNDLKAAGKLESYVEKRRKRNALKDHRYMPYRKSNANAS